MHDNGTSPMPGRRALAGALVVSQALSLAALPAQDEFRAADYLDDGYRSVVVVDFAQLRGSGVWDEMNTGAARLMLRTLERSMDTSFDHLDRFRMVPVALPAADGEEQVGSNVIILERSVPFGLPDGFNEQTWVREAVGAHEILYRDGFPYGHVSPVPHVRIVGPLPHLRSRLQGPERPGMPCPDILSLLSTREDGLLAYLVADLTRAAANEELVARLEQGDWPEHDRPHFLLVRFAATGDADDPHVVLEVVVRHLKVGAGVQVTDEAVAREIEGLIEDPQYRSFAAKLKTRQQVVDGCDLSVTVDLGRARTVVGNLQTLVGSFLGKAAAAGELLPAPADPVRKDAPAGRHQHK